MTRRGDGIGIEVLPTGLRGVRLQQDAPGRVAKIAGFVCETNHDASLLEGLIRMRDLLDEAGQPTRVCTWTNDCHIQSLDITGWSTTELNLHRSKLDDVSATIEMSSSARRLLAHLHCDMIRLRRIERLVRQAGFDLEAIEPTPVAVARLVPPYTMRLLGARRDAQPWRAVVHDRVVVAAAPMVGSDGDPEQQSSELLGSSWSRPIDELRERLVDPAEVDLLVNQPAAPAEPIGLSLVGDAYPEFPDTHVAWGPRIAASLGSAAAAAGLAGRLHQIQPLVAPHAFSDDGGVWVIERIGDVERPPDIATPRRKKRTRSRN